MKVGYVRVSTDKQSYNRQIDMLVAQGVDKRNIYSEKETGRKKDRPELNRMIDELRSGDIVIVAEMSRISRSASDMLEIVKRISEKEAVIKSIKENWLDTSDENPYGQFLVTLTMGLCQLEVDLTRSRVREGVASARARGRIGGRPRKTKEINNAIQLYYNTDLKVLEICKMAGIAKPTLMKAVADIKSKVQQDIADGVCKEKILSNYKIPEKYYQAYLNSMNKKSGE